MPLSYLRRPLFLVLVLYISVLVFLHSRGCFRVDPPEDLLRFKYFAGAVVHGRVVSPLKEDSRGQKIFVQADNLRGKPFRQKLLAYLPKGGDNRILRPGMPIELAGCLRLPRPARNPGEFDEQAFLHDRGASWIMKAESLRVMGPVPKRWLLKSWAEGARQSLEGFLRRILPEDEGHLFAGLTLGFKGPLRRDWNRAVQDAGAMHLLVPSGAKVAFVMLAVLALTLRLGLSPWPRFIAAVLMGGFYTLMVGAEAPYTRAFWAAAALGICQLSGRDSGAFQAMILAALMTLLWDPRELFCAGFQMTYAAVFGLVLAMPQIQKVGRGLPRWLRALAGVAVVSVLVQVMLWPLFANTFGRGSLVGALANLVLVPASGFMLAAGFGAWLASSLSAAADPLLGRALGLCARIFVRVCRLFAGLPGAAVNLSPMSLTAVVVYYLLVMALVILPRWRAALALAAAGLMLWAGSAAAGRWSAAAVRVLLLRLPPAHPALVTFADGRTWLVDPGTKVAAVLKTLRSRGVGRIDRLVLFRPLPHRAWVRLRQGTSLHEALRVPAPWRLCQDGKLDSRKGAVPSVLGNGADGRDKICFEFGGPAGPRVLRGEAQYSIIPSRLKLGAVEVASDGSRAEIR